MGVGVKEGLRENNSGAKGVLAILFFSSVRKGRQAFVILKESSTAVVVKKIYPGRKENAISKEKFVLIEYLLN